MMTVMLVLQAHDCHACIASPGCCMMTVMLVLQAQAGV